MRHPLLFALVPTLLLTAGTRQAAQQATAPAPFAVEYSYKVQWGHFDEWMDLYQKNHYPILVRQMEMGRIVDMYATYPINHSAEGSRWDFRFTIVYRSAADAYQSTIDTAPIIAALYPDREAFQREEQRRFQLLLEHTDVPIRRDDLSAWSKTPGGR
ncbi:MAG: hypothetical protein L0271_10565 [Gemmatimonadetes bacterium]|nr:hypothetical protein [Gemmatimonadota bacterium]